MSTHCKVIAVYMGSRDCRVNETEDNHNQDLPDEYACLIMIKNLVENELKLDAGLEMDTIIVNNDNGFDEGNKYLESIAGTKTKNGIIRVFNRYNVGRAFGAYNHAFALGDYDYFLFQEDDMLFIKNGYYQYYKDLYDKDKNNGAVAVIGLGRKDEFTTHCHGGCCLTSREKMFETAHMKYDFLKTSSPCAKANIGLAHWEDKSEEAQKNTRAHCLLGEVPFTYSLKILGYDLIDSPNKSYWKFYFD